MDGKPKDQPPINRQSGSSSVMFFTCSSLGLTSAGLRKEPEEVLIVNRRPWTAGGVENMPLPAPASRLLGSCCWGLGSRQERFAAEQQMSTLGGEGSLERVLLRRVRLFAFHFISGTRGVGANSWESHSWACVLLGGTGCWLAGSMGRNSVWWEDHGKVLVGSLSGSSSVSSYSEWGCGPTSPVSLLM